MTGDDATIPSRVAGDGVLANAPVTVAGVTLTAADLPGLVRFYAEAIGLSVIDRSAGAVRLGAGRTVLLTLLDRPGAPRWQPTEAGLFHTAFLLPSRGDLGAWLAHARATGITLSGAADHLVSEAVYLSDPEGNGIEVYADRPSSAWSRAEDGTVLMRNSPLDWAGILGSATSPWSGMPDAGRIGHVHLQVGELASAERFYASLLGFDIMRRAPGALFLGSGGYHHQLAGNTWNSRGAGTRPAGGTGLHEVALETDADTFGGVRSRLERAELPHTTEEGSLLVQDPWGTRLRLTLAEAGSRGRHQRPSAAITPPQQSGWSEHAAPVTRH